MKLALKISMCEEETHLLLGALIRARLRRRDNFNEIREILLGELLNSCNHIAKFLPFFGEMILDARWDFQESSPLHKAHLLQDPEPLDERLRTDMSHELSQFVKAFWATQQVNDDQQNPGVSNQTDGASHGSGCTSLGHFSWLFLIGCLHRVSIAYYFEKSNFLDNLNFL
jgi:hypothetical protein